VPFHALIFPVYESLAMNWAFASSFLMFPSVNTGVEREFRNLKFGTSKACCESRTKYKSRIKIIKRIRKENRNRNYR
jgi:hypothetical protein